MRVIKNTALTLEMKKISKLLFTISLMLGAAAPMMAQSPKDIHQKMHSELLADHKNSIDKNAIQDYIRFDLEDREQISLTGFNDLSKESIAMIGDILKEAKTHLGKKYVWGSKGPNTFDCSGFTSYVYKQFGYKISSSSKAQYTQGTPVNKNHLRAGDLVFFTSPRSGSSVGHVGLVLAADNEKGTFTFIHASVSKGIRISESTENYYVKRYIGAKRIITE